MASIWAVSMLMLPSGVLMEMAPSPEAAPMRAMGEGVASAAMLPTRMPATMPQRVTTAV